MATKTALRPLEILVVEDNPADAAMLRLGFETAEIPCHIHVASNGFEALGFLLRSGRDRRAVRPDIVILDLNLPKKGGRDVLARITGDEDLRSIPVAVLTGSESIKDIADVYDNRASCYVTKPSRPGDYATLARFLRNVWAQRAAPRILN